MNNIRQFALLIVSIFLILSIIGCGNPTGDDRGGGGGSSSTLNPVDHISTLDATGGHSTSLALDSTGKPRISYYNSGDFTVYYTKWTGTTWDATALSTGVAAGTCLKLGTQDSWAVAYYYSGGMAYGHGDDSSGSGGTVDTGTYDFSGDYGISMVLDAYDNPRISYYNPDLNALKYAEYTGITWEIATVDAVGDVGKGSSLIINENGSPEISYIDNDNHKLRYARRIGSNWVTAEIDSVSSSGFHNCTSLAIDSASGRRWISYKLDDTSGQKLGVATSEDGVNWTAHQIVDNTLDGGGYSSIKIDGNGIPWIAYYDYGLSYASLESSSWVLVTVEAGTGMGLMPSLALSSSNKPRISYYDSTTGHSNLKYFWE